MKHITYADKSLLVGDEAADIVLEYAAALTRASSGDQVELNAIGADGDEVVATLLLDPGISIMAETTTATFEEPDNADAIADMRAKMAALTKPKTAQPLEKSDFANEFESEFDNE
jgi:hypothetical protein